MVSHSIVVTYPTSVNLVKGGSTEVVAMTGIH